MKSPLEVNNKIDYENEIQRRITKGVIWSLITSVGNKVITMSFAVMIARLLGPKGNGEFVIIQNTLILLSTFAGLGLGTVCTKYIAEFKIRDPSRASKVLMLAIVISIASGICFTAACLLFKDYLSTYLLKNPNLSHPLLYGIIILISGTINSVLQNGLIGFEAFKSNAKITILGGLLTSFSTIMFVYYWHVTGAVLGMVFSSIILLPVYFYSMNLEMKKYDISWQLNRGLLSEFPLIVRFGLPAFISGILFVIVAWILNIILINQNYGYLKLGVFSIANQWRLSLTSIIITLTAVLLPILSDLQGSKNIKVFQETLCENIKMSFILVLPITVLWIEISEPFSKIYGNQYVGSDKIFVILMITFFFDAIGLPLGIGILSKGRMKIYTLLNLFWAVIAIISAIYLCPIYGGIGLAFSYCISHSCHTIAKMIYIDVVLSPKAIRNNRWLIIYSICLVLSTLGAWYINGNLIYIYVILCILSIIPLAKEILNFMQTKNKTTQRPS